MMATGPATARPHVRPRPATIAPVLRAAVGTPRRGTRGRMEGFRQSSDRHSALGMTLVELMVVMAIVVMMVGMSVPALGRYANQMRLKAATRHVVGFMLLARSMAISAHTDHAVVIDPGQHRLTVVNLDSGETLEQAVRLPSSVTVELRVGGQPSKETKVVFPPTGSLMGRTTALVLSDRKQHQTVTITGATGAVTVDAPSLANDPG